MNKTRTIIIGGGFSGVKCAETLTRLGRDKNEVVLFNDENHLVFSPLLAEVVGSSINPMDIIVPLRQLLPGVFCRTESVQNIDLNRDEVEYESGEGRVERMRYDHLVIACGSVTNLNVVPGMADHAFPLKTVGDAAALRSHIMEQLERAEVCSDADRRQWHLSFIVVGGGFSGAEAAGEINDLVRSSACYFTGFGREDVNVTLIHSRDQILPEISPDLREFARKKMEKAGVKMMLNARVGSATPEGVGLQSGEFVKGGTIVCTVGSSAAPVIERLPVPKEKGRIVTEPDMRVRGTANVWAIGDCALVINARDGKPSPTTGQFAERQGKQCAENILRVVEAKDKDSGTSRWKVIRDFGRGLDAGRAAWEGARSLVIPQGGTATTEEDQSLVTSSPTKPFSFKQLGELCSIGGHSAVADLFGVHLSGFLAWFVWRGVYLFKLPTWARRFQVGFDWAWLLLFPRDLAHVRTRQTDRVSHAHYQAGDLIIKQGDPAVSFYVIEQGEVEVVRATPNDPNGEVVAVLGPGSFFGEKALLTNEPRVATVRARTAVEVLVLGRNVFTQISGALAPLRDALAQALNRRAVDVSKGQPEVFRLLKGTPLRDLMEAVPQPLLKPTDTFADVGHAFVEHDEEFFYVSNDGETLEGVVTITDLLRARNGGAMGETPVGEFMTKNPVALAVDDDCGVAAAAIREYRLKSLPVVERKDNRKLAGCIRVRKLMAYVFKELGTKGEEASAKSEARMTNA